MISRFIFSLSRCTMSVNQFHNILSRMICGRIVNGEVTVPYHYEIRERTEASNKSIWYINETDMKPEGSSHLMVPILKHYPSPSDVSPTGSSERGRRFQPDNWIRIAIVFIISIILFFLPLQVLGWKAHFEDCS
jgi:hypothetical protein